MCYDFEIIWIKSIQIGLYKTANKALSCLVYNIFLDIIYICIKGLVYCSSHNCHFHIDREVSTADFRSSSGDIVDLLSQTICTTDGGTNSLTQ